MACLALMLMLVLAPAVALAQSRAGARGRRGGAARTAEAEAKATTTTTTTTDAEPDETEIVTPLCELFPDAHDENCECTAGCACAGGVADEDEGPDVCVPPETAIDARSNALRADVGLWPMDPASGIYVVKYAFYGSFKNKIKAHARKVLSRLSKATNMNFVESRSGFHLQLTKSNSCASYIGIYQSFGPRYGGQPIWLRNGCTKRQRVLVHEVMHALGYHHEHKRHDASRVLQKFYKNIKYGDNGWWWKQFTAVNTPSETNSETPDLYSVMMYRPKFKKQRGTPATMFPLASLEGGAGPNGKPTPCDLYHFILRYPGNPDKCSGKYTENMGNVWNSDLSDDGDAQPWKCVDASVYEQRCTDWLEQWEGGEFDDARAATYGEVSARFDLEILNPSGSSMCVREWAAYVTKDPTNDSAAFSYQPLYFVADAFGTANEEMGDARSLVATGIPVPKSDTLSFRYRVWIVYRQSTVCGSGTGGVKLTASSSDSAATPLELGGVGFASNSILKEVLLDIDVRVDGAGKIVDWVEVHRKTAGW